ncbi:hypothetical protein AtubIFM57143_000419 [Aspergillus tubingensis]|nr:hypothetical protein AtubIFM57143_000419 [Aspergillus tubingensis]
MSIPIRHMTTSDSLLLTSNAQVLAGEWPADVFLKSEQKRQSLSQTSSAACGELSLPSESSIPHAVQIYFTKVHPRHPILNAEKWRDNPPTINREVNVLTTNLVLVMLVVALAEISVASAQQIKDGHLAGASYVQEAVHWLTSTWLNKCSTDLYLCQALFLAASWFNYACKPLEAWRMIHLASTNIQHAFLASSNRKTNPALDPDLVRLCWAIFLTECDILAEYHLPRSGIENVVERLPYPGCHETPEFDSLAWLANLSARRLMNRVHFTMYDISTYNGGDADPGSRLPALNNLLDSDKASLLIASSKELDHQLHLWWDLLPPAIKPQFDESELDPIKETLSLRYFACGDIIYRPFIYKVCSMPCDRVPDRFLVDAAIKCIRYSREVLKHVACLTQTPSPNTMINLHSTLAALINLAVASLSPFLKEEVTDIDHLDDLAITILERWASDGSSRGIMLHVAKTIRDKRRMITAFDL